VNGAGGQVTSTLPTSGLRERFGIPWLSAEPLDRNQQKVSECAVTRSEFGPIIQPITQSFQNENPGGLRWIYFYSAAERDVGLIFEFLSDRSLDRCGTGSFVITMILQVDS